MERCGKASLKKILFPVDRPTGYLFQGHSGGFLLLLLLKNLEKKMKEINDHPY